MIPIVLKVYDGGKLKHSRAFSAERIRLGSASADLVLDSSSVSPSHAVIEAGVSGAVLRALLRLIEKKTDRGFLEKAQKNMSSWNELMAKRGTRTDMPMKPQVVVWELNKLLDDDAIVVTDSGTITGLTARFIHMRGTMKFAVSGSADETCGSPMSTGNTNSQSFWFDS